MSHPIGESSGITSKLTALLRLGLVSKNNMARAITVFKNPEKAMTSSANRMLMQEILVDIMDRILNNKTLYSIVRQNLIKNQSSPAVTESVEDERAKTLFRSGLVQKKHVMLARRAITNHDNLKSMSAIGVYREMMIGMLDSMVKKITGNPVLFNAFKRTLGKETVEESFTCSNSESISELFLDVDYALMRETNKPSNAGLWSQAKTIAKSKSSDCSSDLIEVWATKWYNENGGNWKPIQEGKKFFGFVNDVNQLQELNRETLHNYTYRARDNAKELEAWGKTYGSSDKDRLKIKNRKKGMKTALKKLGHTFIEMAQSHNRRREMEKHLSKPLNNWMKDLDNNEKNDNEHLYGLGGKKVKFRTRKKRALATGMKEWIEGESQKGVSDKARSIAREIHRKYNTQKQVEMPTETPSTSPKKIESQSRARQNRKNRATRRANT